MTTEEWAKNEVRIAMEKERKAADKDDGIGVGYVSACYDSALKAYHSLCEDGHSGMSWGVTASILTKLLYEAPLTPIEEDEDCWGSKDSFSGEEQCLRRFSLFRRKQKDGTYKYHDIDLVATDYVYTDHISAFGSKNGDMICEMLYGELIKFPYCPSKERYRVRMIEFDNIHENGKPIYYVIFAQKPNGERTWLNDFYSLGWDGPKKLKAADVEPKLSEKDQKVLAEKLAYSNAHK
jgi:hypothetical protein